MTLLSLETISDYQHIMSASRTELEHARLFGLAYNEIISGLAESYVFDSQACESAIRTHILSASSLENRQRLTRTFSNVPVEIGRKLLQWEGALNSYTDDQSLLATVMHDVDLGPDKVGDINDFAYIRPNQGVIFVVSGQAKYRELVDNKVLNSEGSIFKPINPASIPVIYLAVFDQEIRFPRASRSILVSNSNAEPLYLHELNHQLLHILTRRGFIPSFSSTEFFWDKMREELMCYVVGAMGAKKSYLYPLNFNAGDFMELYFSKDMYPKISDSVQDEIIKNFHLIEFLASYCNVKGIDMSVLLYPILASSNNADMERRLLRLFPFERATLVEVKRALNLIEQKILEESLSRNIGISNNVLDMATYVLERSTLQRPGRRRVGSDGRSVAVFAQ